MTTLPRALMLLIVLPTLLWSQAATSAPITRIVNGVVTYVGQSVPFGIALNQAVTAQVDFDDGVGDGDHPINSINGFGLTITLGTDPAIFSEDADGCFDDQLFNCGGLLPAFSTVANQITNLNYVGSMAGLALSVLDNGTVFNGMDLDWTLYDGSFTVLAAGTFEFAVIPEPASALLLFGGLAGIAASRRRRRAQA